MTEILLAALLLAIPGPAPAQVATDQPCESFEMEITNPPWSTAPLGSWQFTDETAWDGRRSLRSLAAPTAWAASLEALAQVREAGVLSFAIRTELPAGEELRFYTGPLRRGTLTGVTPWTRMELSVPAGTYRVSWQHVRAAAAEGRAGVVYLDAVGYPGCREAWPRPVRALGSVATLLLGLSLSALAWGGHRHPQPKEVCR